MLQEKKMKDYDNCFSILEAFDIKVKEKTVKLYSTQHWSTISRTLLMRAANIDVTFTKIA